MNRVNRALIYSFQFGNILGFTINAIVDNTSNWTILFTALFVVSTVMVLRDISAQKE